MTDPNSSESPLDVAAGTVGPHTVEAFSTLANETRLSILLALWEAYEPWGRENAVPFSELRERVGRPDSGQFNYHLEKLRGHFVRKSEAGYELQRAGEQLVRAVIAGTGIEDTSFDRLPLEDSCSLCGGPKALTFTDGLLVEVCTACEGRYRYGTDYPEGTLWAVEFDPAGLAGRTPEEMLEASSVGFAWHFVAAVEGVCGTCSGRMERYLHVCPDHDESGICPTCERRERVMARVSCTVCKRNQAASPAGVAFFHPAVVAFFYERGVSVMHDEESVETRLAFEHLDSFDVTEELVAEDPPRVQVTYRLDGDRLVVTLDEHLQVDEAEEPS